MPSALGKKGNAKRKRGEGSKDFGIPVEKSHYPVGFKADKKSDPEKSTFEQTGRLRFEIRNLVDKVLFNSLSNPEEMLMMEQFDCFCYGLIPKAYPYLTHSNRIIKHKTFQNPSVMVCANDKKMFEAIEVTQTLEVIDVEMICDRISKIKSLLSGCEMDTVMSAVHGHLDGIMNALL